MPPLMALWPRRAAAAAIESSGAGAAPGGRGADSESEIGRPDMPATGLALAAGVWWCGASTRDFEALLLRVASSAQRLPVA